MDDFKASQCFESLKTGSGDSIFRGPLEGSADCLTYRASNVIVDGDLFDIYQGYVGFDDLYDYFDDL